MREWLIAYHLLIPHSCEQARLGDTRGVIPINVHFPALPPAAPTVSFEIYNRIAAPSQDGDAVSASSFGPIPSR